MIRIFFSFIILCLMHANSYAKEVSLQWDQNSNNQIETYSVYYGNESGEYPWNEPADLQSCDGSTCEFTLDLPDGSWYFAVTASDMYERESDFSNEVYIEISESSTLSICDGDLDYDGDVDHDDLSIIVSEFGRDNCHLELCSGDLDSDGDVDLRDIVIFFQEFGRTDCL